MPHRARPATIRVVVFDIYGTLFSSGVGDISLATERVRDAALKAVLTDNGIRISSTGAETRIDDRCMPSFTNTKTAAGPGCRVSRSRNPRRVGGSFRTWSPGNVSSRTLQPTLRRW